MPVQTAAAVASLGEGASDGAHQARRNQAPIRVMHVVYSMEPGGMEFGVLKLVNGLDPARIESSICSTRPAGNLKSLVRCGIPVFDLQRRAGNDLRLVWQLSRLLRRERPHVVHTHAWGTMLEGLVAARLARVPVVIHGEHGTLQLQTRQRWLQRKGWGWADHVLSVSSRLAERMSRETGFPLERIETIRNGVDLSRFGGITRAEARAALGLPATGIVIGAVGRLVPVKAHTALIDALKLLGREGLAPMLVIAGDGPLKGTLVSKAATLGMESQVRLLGHRTDVEQVLAALDVFVLSSVSEGLPNTVLEAMAASLPVVSTRVGGADEVVTDGITGTLVEPGSTEALARGIADIIRDPERCRAMGIAARARAENEFALAETVRRYEALYLRLTGGSRQAA